MTVLKFPAEILRPEGCTVLAKEPNVQCVLTTLGSIWLLNRSNQCVNLEPQELFGFNVGSFQEVNAGKTD